MLKIIVIFTDTATQSGAYECGQNHFSSKKEALGLIQWWGLKE